MPHYSEGPKRGQRLETHQRNQANALRKGKKTKDASGSKSGGAAIGSAT